MMKEFLCKLFRMATYIQRSGTFSRIFIQQQTDGRRCSLARRTYERAEKPMTWLVGTPSRMGKTPYVEASVGIYNIFKLLHIEYVRRLTYTDIPGVKKGGIRFMILMIF